MTLILILPLFLIIALLIKLDSSGPVFFSQKRVGIGGKIFSFLKFRTMINNAENIGLGLGSAENDPRITKIGRFLREWTLDEIPQFINVLKGEMSLVGPRPIPKPEINNPKIKELWEKRIKVKPGLVSLVDIKGRNLVPWEKRFEYDAWYIDNQSLWLDFKILILGFLAVLSRKGVYGKGGVNPGINEAKIIIHQPEFLPYIGFFQRIAEADILVALDDVGYQKNAFINRNKIKTKNGLKWITVPVKNRSSNSKINEVLIDNSKNWADSILGSISANYSKAPYFKDYFIILKDILSKKWDKIADLDICLLETINKILGINLRIIRSSELIVDGRGEERLIKICKKLKADSYLSGPGCEGHQINRENFEKEGMKVDIKEFLDHKYSQLFPERGFLSYMSIIDLLFNEGPKSLEIIKLSSKKNII
jgi:lipopolysaccharide/colanic/teichoic acid biosynthesis glycosyltransferase